MDNYYCIIIYNDKTSLLAIILGKKVHLFGLIFINEKY